ncbi:hypothetical protein K438DRAFT_1813047 [Mycena galopus ATCC 62051]|nr:hypothetical protein K438DRAFT_1813047 [Mycena galopus ATCC 62051]
MVRCGMFVYSRSACIWCGRALPAADNRARRRPSGDSEARQSSRPCTQGAAAHRTIGARSGVR